MLKYELVAIDLDGTLLDRGGKLSPENRGALHRAHAAGLKVVICTGRSFTETRPILDQIGLDLDASVTVGGALINDVASGATLERYEIERGLAAEVLEWFRSQRLSVLWLIDRSAAGFDGYCLWHEVRHPAIQRWLDKSGCAMRVLEDVPSEVVNPLRVTVIDEPENLPVLAERFLKVFGKRVNYNVIDVPLYKFAVLESFAGQVDKWSGIVRLCKRWSIDPRRTVTIGDDVNDVCMIEAAGLGVAVGNAIEDVKRVAKHCVRRHDEHGVAELIDYLLADGRAGAAKGQLQSAS